MKNIGQCFVKENNFVTREIAGETIIVPIRGHVGDLNSIYTLNEIGTFIWKLIDGKNQVSEIVKAVGDTFDVLPEEAEKDAIEFLRSLETANLIQALEEGEAPAPKP